MSTYTNIPKPTDSTYVRVNFQGKQTYDDSSITYDDTSVFYDSVSEGAYTNVLKPQASGIKAGMKTGLMIPLTYTHISPADQWTKINKPT